MNKLWVGLAAGAFTLSAPAYAQLSPPLVWGLSSSNDGGLDNLKYTASSGVTETSSSRSFEYAGVPSYGATSNTLAIDAGARSLVSDTHIESKGLGGGNGGSYSSMTYYFSVNGPTPTVAIDISAIATLGRSAFWHSAPNYVYASQWQYVEVYVKDDQNHYVIGGTVNSGFNFAPAISTVVTSGMFTNPGTTANTIDEAFFGTYFGSKTGTIDTNRQYSIWMTLHDTMSYSYSPDVVRSVSTHASLSDLAVNINSAFADAGDYQITFGASAAVPEPASWAMFIGGFGLIGAAMRRKKVGFGLVA